MAARICVAVRVQVGGGNPSWAGCRRSGRHGGAKKRGPRRRGNRKRDQQRECTSARRRPPGNVVTRAPFLRSSDARRRAIGRLPERTSSGAPDEVQTWSLSTWPSGRGSAGADRAYAEPGSRPSVRPRSHGIGRPQHAAFPSDRRQPAQRRSRAGRAALSGGSSDPTPKAGEEERARRRDFALASTGPTSSGAEVSCDCRHSASSRRAARNGLDRPAPVLSDGSRKGGSVARSTRVPPSVAATVDSIVALAPPRLRTSRAFAASRTRRAPSSTSSASPSVAKVRAIGPIFMPSS